MPNLESYFAADGILARFVPGYRALAQQREMAEMIPRAELAVIPGAAHNDVLIENGLFLNLVLDFLTTQSN